MKAKYLLCALALGASTSAFAAEPAPAPKKECCCKKDEQGKMACCKEEAEKAEDHSAHAVDTKEHK